MRLGYNCMTSASAWPRRGFNEAEAHAPRIHGVFMTDFTLDATASMRPRRMRLGYQSVAADLSKNLLSFNEAEAHAPRIQPGS